MPPQTRSSLRRLLEEAPAPPPPPSIEEQQRLQQEQQQQPQSRRQRSTGRQANRPRNDNQQTDAQQTDAQQIEDQPIEDQPIEDHEGVRQPPTARLRRSAPGRSALGTSARAARTPVSRRLVPSVYHDMLAELGPEPTLRQTPVERPVKRRRVPAISSPAQEDRSINQPDEHIPDPTTDMQDLHTDIRVDTDNDSLFGSPIDDGSDRDNNNNNTDDHKIGQLLDNNDHNGPFLDDHDSDKDSDRDGDSDSDSDIHFEDVPLPVVQRTEREIESDSESEDSDTLESTSSLRRDIISTSPTTTLSIPSLPFTHNHAIELDLSRPAAPPTAKPTRRKPIDSTEKDLRLRIHMLHTLCLLAHAARRNHACNDSRVHVTLRKLAGPKLLAALQPNRKLSRFGRFLAVQEALKTFVRLFRDRFRTTECGMRRALWAEPKQDAPHCMPPLDLLDSCFDKSDFRRAAHSFSGSRDVGAQLACALLRAADVDTRLVCSLQPLPLVAAASAGGSGPTRTKQETLRATTKKNNRESKFPVWWVEVFDEAHQLWRPIDPIVTRTIFPQPFALEPPTHDRENKLVYVFAFDARGAAKDVTQRYTRYFTARTAPHRVESVSPETKAWWRKLVRLFRDPKWTTDADEQENKQLRELVEKEPIPTRLADFRHHPKYILERQLNRLQVFAPGASPCGTISLGKKGSPPENVYLRSDVCVLKSREQWFRLGRTVKLGEQPSKMVAKSAQKKLIVSTSSPPLPEVDVDASEASVADLPSLIPMFTQNQTELFQHPPVVDGKIPKNQFGNVEIYVPSMIPAGGAYIAHELARRAAFLVGVDYAPVLTGFSFRGRHGTAVFRGVLVARENYAAVRSVIRGLENLAVEREARQRSDRALALWRRFLLSLRIRDRIWANVTELPTEPPAVPPLEGALGLVQEDPELEVNLDEGHDTEGDEMMGGFFVD